MGNQSTETDKIVYTVKFSVLHSHPEKYFGVYSREFFQLDSTAFKIHGYNWNPHAKMSEWEVSDLFSRPQFGPKLAV